MDSDEILDNTGGSTMEGVDDWVIFDLCGTLADITHRLPEIKEGKYFDSMEKIPDDKLKVDIFSLYEICVDSFCRIAIVTGRDEKFRHHTKAWLKKHGITYSELHMRPADDNRSDDEIKQEIYLSHFKSRRVLFVVDDRQGVVDMWRKHGLTCLQCQEGDY